MITKKDIMQEHNDIYRREVDLFRIKNDIDKQRILKEQETKNRVDISLKEYEEMKERIETLTKANDNLYESLRKFIRPFLEANIPTEVVEKIREGKYESYIQIVNSPCENRICHVIKINMLEKIQ